MLKIEELDFDSLTAEEQGDVSDNGSGKKYANYIRIQHDGETILLESDAMEPEDATFNRDLGWVADMFSRCYDLGKKDAGLAM